MFDRVLARFHNVFRALCAAEHLAVELGGEELADRARQRLGARRRPARARGAAGVVGAQEIGERRLEAVGVLAVVADDLADAEAEGDHPVDELRQRGALLRREQVRRRGAHGGRERAEEARLLLLLRAVLGGGAREGELAVAGEGDWGGSPCLQAVLANDHAPNESPGGRCVADTSHELFDLSNSLAGGGKTDDLEINVFLHAYEGPGTYQLAPEQRFEVRIGQENFEWVHWIAGDWGGECTLVVDEGERSGRASCSGLTGRYGPELGSGEAFGVYDVEASWSCPPETPS